jgi:hypothetical protein
MKKTLRILDEEVCFRLNELDEDERELLKALSDDEEDVVCLPLTQFVYEADSP